MVPVMSRTDWLQDRIELLWISDSVRCTMEFELERLAQIDGQGFDPDEAGVIVGIVGEPTTMEHRAPFTALRPYADVFLTACLHVAVVDGRYSQEQARHISWLALQIGWSAAQLAALERRVLQRLEERGRRVLAAS